MHKLRPARARIGDLRIVARLGFFLAVLVLAAGGGWALGAVLHHLPTAATAPTR